MNSRFKVFIDFDGTITVNDVGYELFKKMTDAATEPTVAAYRNGEINSLACLSGECEIWNRKPPDTNKVWKFIDNQPISPGFDRFIEYLRQSNIETKILSEGFDFYIDRILSRCGFDHINRITNKAIFSDGLLSPEFPHFGKGCGQCSNCKGYHIANDSRPDQSIVFIGDGHSDSHAAEKVDILFAKSFLKEYLGDNGRCFFSYNDFVDILDIFQKLNEKGVYLVSQRINLCLQFEKHHAGLIQLWESAEVMKYVGFPEGLGWDSDKYEKHWKTMAEDTDNIYLALENKDGLFLGEAKISYPDESGICEHDLKLLPEYWGKGLAREAWLAILEASARRWPKARALVTPSVENNRAIKLYESLGFKPDGGEETWNPGDIPKSVAARFIRMIKE